MVWGRVRIRKRAEYTAPEPLPSNAVQLLPNRRISSVS